MNRLFASLLIFSFVCSDVAFAEVTKNELLACRHNWRNVLDRYLISHFKYLCIEELQNSLICGSVAGGVNEAGKKMQSVSQSTERAAKRAAAEVGDKTTDTAAKKVFQDTVNKAGNKTAQNAAGTAARKAFYLQVEKVVEASIITGTAKLGPKWQRRVGSGISRLAKLGGLGTGAGAVISLADADATACAELNHRYMMTDANNNCKPVYRPGQQTIDFLKLPPKEQERLLGQDPELCDYYTGLAKEFEEAASRQSFNNVKLTQAQCQLTQAANDDLPLIYQMNFRSNWGRSAEEEYRIVYKGREGGMTVQKLNKKQGLQHYWQELYQLNTVLGEDGQEKLDRVTVYQNQYVEEARNADGKLLKSERTKGIGKTYSITGLDPQLLRENPVLMSNIRKARALHQLNAGYYKPVMETCCTEGANRPDSCNILLGNNRQGQYLWDNPSTQQ